jgi:hypothetical protein
MTLRQFYLQRRQVEFPTFLRVLKALPKEQLQYKPHDRSPSAEQFVWTLTTELKACLDAVGREQGRVEGPSGPPSVPKGMFLVGS